MSAIKKFDHPKELLYKLHREGRRANLSNNETDILDSEFNFCVTGHSLRDWIVKHLQLNEHQKSKFHNNCNQNNYLKYCRDIAQSILVWLFQSNPLFHLLIQRKLSLALFML